MVKVVNPTRRFSGTIQVPADKSITHRAVLLSSLGQGLSTIFNPLVAEDCLSSLRCVEALGCHVEEKPGVWRIEGRGLWGFKPQHRPLDCGNSGTTMRLLSGILAGQDFETTLVGDDSLSRRPMDRIAQPLTAMGAHFNLTNQKFAPMKIRGRKPLKALQWTSPVASAQVKSAVLLAGLHAEGETRFLEPALSRDHTERMLPACGAAFKKVGEMSTVQGPATIKPMTWTVPGDFSSAAFFVAAALMIEQSEVVCQSVNLNPTRTGLLQMLSKMGANIQIKNKTDVGGELLGDICIQGRADLRGGTLEPSLVPSLIDEIPILSVLATQAKGKTILSGLSELRIKETDRIKAMAQNLSALGAHISEMSDGLVITGPTALSGGTVDSFSDHRIAMSMAVAGLISKAPITIKDSQSVNISFPGFWDILDSLVGIQ